MPRSGRPKSVTTPRVKKLIRERIRRNPQRSLRKMAAGVHISRGSMQNLVKKNSTSVLSKGKLLNFFQQVLSRKGYQEAGVSLLCSKMKRLNDSSFPMRSYSILKKLSTKERRILAPNSSSIPKKYLYVPRTQKPRSIMV